MPTEQYTYVSSSRLIKDVFMLGEMSRPRPPLVMQRLKAKATR